MLINLSFYYLHNEFVMAKVKKKIFFLIRIGNICYSIASNYLQLAQKAVFNIV